jgi:hypothetical protein
METQTTTTTQAEAAMLSALKFCERCKGSIPEAEFHDGRALHVGSKHVHVDCLLKRSAWLEVLALVLALYAAGAVTYLLTKTESPKSETAPTAAAPANGAPEAKQALSEARDAAKRASAAEADVAALKGEVARASSDAARQADALRDSLVTRLSQESKAATGALEAKLTAIETNLAGLQALDGKFNALATALADLRKQIAALKPADGGSAPPK